MTKHNSGTNDSTRQADALSQGEIEITPAMVEAGITAFWDLDVEDVGSAVVVVEVFKAMMATSRR